jgi:hypothetical protein
MSKAGSGWVVPVLAALLIGAVVGTVIVLVGSGDEEEPPRSVAEERRNDRDRERERKAQQLKKALETRRPEREAPKGLEMAQKLGIIKGEDQPEPLTREQRLALKSVLDDFYSPRGLADALRNRTAPDYAREVGQKYREAVEREEIDYSRGVVPVTPEVKQVLDRMGVVKDYVMNMLHTMRPEGQEELQQQMMDRMNDSIGRRIDQLNADYPFLGIQKVESL